MGWSKKRKLWREVSEHEGSITSTRGSTPVTKLQEVSNVLQVALLDEHFFNSIYLPPREMQPPFRANNNNFC